MISGRGLARDEDGETRIEEGDAFVYPPGEAHGLINDGEEHLVLYVVADNPVGEACHYPDSGKWLVPLPARKIVQCEERDYYEGEE